MRPGLSLTFQVDASAWDERDERHFEVDASVWGLPTGKFPTKLSTTLGTFILVGMEVSDDELEDLLWVDYRRDGTYLRVFND
jgi:hypothetical protein